MWLLSLSYRCGHIPFIVSCYFGIPWWYRFLLTLFYHLAQIDSACVHSLEFTPFHWRLAESFSFPQSSKSISKISLHWRDVQRLSRLSGIRKKYWNRASLHSSCTIQCHTYSEMIKLERNSSLSLIQFQVIIVLLFCFSTGIQPIHWRTMLKVYGNVALFACEQTCETHEWITF